METTIKYLITLESFNIGAASVNFLFNVFTKIGLVRTHSIHYSIQTPYTKSRKSSGLLKEFKTKKPDSKLKSGFLRAGDGTRTRNLLITNQGDSSFLTYFHRFLCYSIQNPYKTGRKNYVPGQKPKITKLSSCLF